MFVNNPNDSSYLAVVAGLCGEADYIFIPEDPPTADWPQRLCKQLSQASASIPSHSLHKCFVSLFSVNHFYFFWLMIQDWNLLLLFRDNEINYCRFSSELDNQYCRTEVDCLITVKISTVDLVFGFFAGLQNSSTSTTTRTTQILTNNNSV